MKDGRMVHLYPTAEHLLLGFLIHTLERAEANHQQENQPHMVNIDALHAA